jgi:ABC-type polysaccharide/polyol phosphate transport system ATPase subunit
VKNEKTIDVKDVSIKFNLSQEKVDNLKEYLVKLVKRELLFQEFYALQHVSFSVNKGETIGIVGLNGAGKSTLLKIIAGVLKPSSGTVQVKGNIAPLIELGAGFDSNLTGRENIILNGCLLGQSKRIMYDKIEEIIDFSELRDFIDVPLKNYSSGMKARLGFSIATLVKADILIIDEVLSVGDFKFQKKCEKRIEELRDKNVTVLFVSHSIEKVAELCNRVLWLEKGHVKMYDEAKVVCERFKNS